MPWRLALFKGTRVYTRCDDEGNPVTSDGRVEIRYRLDDERSYRAHERNVELVAGEAPIADGGATTSAVPRQRRKTLPKRRGARASHEFVVVYTDGACEGNPGPAGSGVVIVKGGRIRELSHYLGEGTNNIAELMAIELALAEIGVVDAPVRLYTDSEYAINVLTKGWKAKKNVELVERLRELVRRLPDLELIHVPAHSGIAMNERADQLAVRAVKDRASRAWRDGAWPT